MIFDNSLVIAMKLFYFLACIVGILLPYWEIVPFVQQHGVNIGLLIEQVRATQMSRAFMNDFAVTALVILAFTVHEGWRIGVKIAYLLACFGAMFLSGASFALPLFLLLREIKREKHLKVAS
jgi:hypothetical protein